MNLKAVVKVMNFHSLLRVDSARRKAEKYAELERAVANMIGYIVYNRNFLLDKKFMVTNPSAPALNIYFGSDYGFCSSINANVNAIIAREEPADKLVVGRKLRLPTGRVLMRLTREEFDADYAPIAELIADSLDNRLHSSINLIYNHYYNTTDIELTRRCIFPLELGKSADYHDDFVVEGDAYELLNNLIRSYVNYEIKIAAVNCFASENIMRQSATSESLKKIDEREAEALTAARKARAANEFRKVVDSYIKKKGLEVK